MNLGAAEVFAFRQAKVNPDRQVSATQRSVRDPSITVHISTSLTAGFSFVTVSSHFSVPVLCGRGPLAHLPCAIRVIDFHDLAERLEAQRGGELRERGVFLSAWRRMAAATREDRSSGTSRSSIRAYRCLAFSHRARVLQRPISSALLSPWLWHHVNTGGHGCLFRNTRRS